MFQAQIHEFFTSGIGFGITPCWVVSIPVTCYNVGGGGMDLQEVGDCWDGGGGATVDIGDD